MDWGLISGLASLFGLIWQIIRLGEWKGRIEEQMKNQREGISANDKKTEALAIMQNQQNVELAKIGSKMDNISEKVDILVEQQQKKKRKKGDE